MWFGMLSDTQASQTFCNLQVKNDIDLIFISITTLIFIVVLSYMIYRFFQLRKIKLNRTIKKLIVAMIVWIACFGIKLGFNILLYVMSKDKDQNSQDVQNFLSDVSKLYFCIDWTSAFLIQYMIMLIPYHWMRKMNDIMKQLLSASNIQEQHSSSRIIKFLRVYLKLRLLAVPTLFLIIFIKEFSVEFLICLILLSLFLLESVATILFYLKGLLSLKRNKKIQDILDQGQVSTMKNQYMILILSCILRIILDFFTGIILGFAFGYLFPKKCSYTEQNQCGIPYSVVLLIISPVFTHFIPIIIALRIFSVQQPQPSLSKSLLIATSQYIEN